MPSQFSEMVDLLGLDKLRSENFIFNLDETSKSAEDDMNGAEKKNDKSLILKPSKSSEEGSVVKYHNSLLKKSGASTP